MTTAAKIRNPYPARYNQDNSTPVNLMRVNIDGDDQVAINVECGSEIPFDVYRVNGPSVQS